MVRNTYESMTLLCLKMILKVRLSALTRGYDRIFIPRSDGCCAEINSQRQLRKDEKTSDPCFPHVQVRPQFL